jgi:hypothetical protein
VSPSLSLEVDVPTPAGFVQAVRRGVDGWLVAAVERTVVELDTPTKQQRLAADCNQAAVLLKMLRQRQTELLRLVAAALREQIDAHARELVAPAAGGTADAEPARRAPGQALAGTRPPPRSLQLTLISEAQIDDEIETARIVQLIESGCESELQELAALCSGLAGRASVEPGTVPLRPSECARALREGVGRFTTDAATRPALLRALGRAVGEQMHEVYAAQIEWLKCRDVRPAAFCIRSAPGAAAAPGESAVAAELPAPPAETMHELVQWARRTQPAPLDMADAPEPAASGRPDEPLEAGALRLFDSPTSYEPAVAPLPKAAAQDLMRGLFAELRRQADATPGMAGLLQRVEQLAQRMAAADPALWSEPGHPWWQLLDRLLASGAVHDDLSPLDQRVLRESLDGLLQQVERAPRLDGTQCMAAAEELQTLASRLLEDAAAPPAEEVDALQRLADREELEAGFRNQIVQQLRSTPTSSAMRRFLVGPWTLVLVALAQQRGAESPEVAAAALVVDDLIRATARPGQRVSKAQRTVLLRQVGDGLARAGLQAPRIDAELVELADILRQPPPHPEGADEAWQDEPIAPLPLPVTLDLHAGLPTVPMALPDGATGTRATPLDWLGTLQPGTCCRLFLQGRWMTARLHWVGPGQRLFLFQSRHGGRSHSLTARMLQRLREAGLATSIEDNLLRAQAMDSLLRHTVV